MLYILEMWFKEYLLESETNYEEEIKKTLNQLPKSHAALIKGFKYEFQGGNTLKGDNGHVGLIDTKRKKIIIAAPWNYPRQFTLLHELAHLLYKKLPPEIKKKWAKIAKNTKIKKGNKQGIEESFCMAYGATYCKHPPLTHHHKEWIEFIKNIGEL